jgi:hypothetical protein
MDKICSRAWNGARAISLSLWRRRLCLWAQ